MEWLLTLLLVILDAYDANANLFVHLSLTIKKYPSKNRR